MPALAGILSGACGGTRNLPEGGTDASKADVDSGVKIGPYHPDASCLVTIDMPDIGPAMHVDVDSSIMFTSNPPAGGPHYPIWARWSTSFGQYQTPVPRGYYVHNQEHGGVVLLYKCSGSPDGGFSPDGGSCAEQAEAFLWKAVNALPTDPGCMSPVRVASVITPDPYIPTPIAAAAWGWTYTSECQDLPTLIDFVKARYGRAPESPATSQAECAEGSYP